MMNNTTGVMERKKVRDRIRTLTYDFEGSIDDAIEALQKLKKETKTDKYYAQWDSFEIDNVHVEYDEGYELALFGIRLENDKEYSERMKQQAENEKWRRKQYEQLKKEFEGEKEAKGHP